MRRTKDEDNLVDMLTSPQWNARSLEKLLLSYEFNVANEEELQRAVEQILTENSVTFVCEYEFPPIAIEDPSTVTHVYSDTGYKTVETTPRKQVAKDRIDFLVGNVGLEIKVGFSYADVIRQLHRYAAHEEIKVLILLTTRLQHTMPEEISGKKLCTVNIALASSL